MARLLTTGFELNDLANNTMTGHPDPMTTAGLSPGLCTLQTGTVRTGNYAAKVAYDGVHTSYFTYAFTAATTVTYYVRAYWQASTLSNGSGAMLAFVQGSTIICSLGVASVAGNISFIDANNNVTSSSNGVVAASVWARFELSVKVDTGTVANSSAEGRVNGVTMGTASGADVGTNLPTEFWVGAIAPPFGTASDHFIDDVALNDSTGGNQNTWADTGQIVLLKPTADSAVGTGWLKGNTGAAPLWQNLDDTPPTSATDLTANADTMQIRNATSNANSNYDATMTTYTAAGANATDIINVIIPYCVTGAPVTTNAKQGTVGVASNPTITNIALSATGTSGAFWAGAACGAYPTGVKWSAGTATYNASVTKGTAPVMRVTQVTSSTRIAIVAEMFMYVDFTASPAPGPDVVHALRVN